MTLGQSITHAREGQDVPLRKLAELAGISPSYLCDIEKDRRIPSPTVCAAIEDALCLNEGVLAELAEEAVVQRWRDES